MSFRTRLAAVIGAIIILAAAGYGALVLIQPRHELPVEYYRIVDSTTLAIGVSGGSGTWDRTSVVAFSPSTVQITAESSNWPFMLSPGMAVPKELSLTLPEPLGDRTVTDADGRVVPRR